MLPTWNFDEDATYLITGGFGGLGRCTARWMSTRNAKNLILLGRRGAKSSSAKQLMEELTSKGITVAAPPCDVTDRDALARVLAGCNRTMPSIKGCIVGTMVLKVKSITSQPKFNSSADLTQSIPGLCFRNHALSRLSNPNQPQGCRHTKPPRPSPARP